MTENLLKEARQTLENLLSDLPSFQKLVSDNEATEADLQSKYRADKASVPFTSLVETKNSVLVAKELLSQHQSEIEAARAEVERLEASVAEENRQRKILELEAELKRLEDEFYTIHENVYKQFAKSLKGLQSARVQHQSILDELRGQGGYGDGLPTYFYADESPRLNLKVKYKGKLEAKLQETGIDGYNHALPFVLNQLINVRE